MPFDIDQIPLDYQVTATDIAALSKQNRIKGIHPLLFHKNPSVVILCTVEGGEYPDRWLDEQHTQLRYCMEGRKDPKTGLKVYKPDYQSNRSVIQSQAKGYPVHVFWRRNKGSKFDYAGRFVFDHVDQDPTTIAFVLTRIGSAALMQAAAAEQAYAVQAIGQFDPTNVQDARQRVITEIVRRQGQPAFRKALLEAYEGRCAVTGYDLPDALEAAHITPYRGEESNDTTNGLLLRVDLHALFDLGLIAIDTHTMKLLLHSRLLPTAYASLAGVELMVPANPAQRPSVDALNQHRGWAGL